MPRYAVDFLAEIQEVNSVTNVDDCSDTVDLITNCHPFSAATEQPSVEDNVVSALMGNAQCCFRRYPGYQAHRHVVVSRGVQCSDAIIRRNEEFDKDIENNCLFNPRTNERGDNINDNYKIVGNASGPVPFVQLNSNLNSNLKFEFLQSLPETLTSISKEPPELKESSNFLRKKYSLDFKKSRKYLDDDIDSLSATISNYSLHDKLLNIDANKLNKNIRIYEQVDKNNHQSANVLSMTPTSRQRHSSLRGSNDAIRGSTTKTVSHDSRISNRNEFLENQSSDSFNSLGQAKDCKGGLGSVSGEYTESTPNEPDHATNVPQVHVNNETMEKVNIYVPSAYEDSPKCCTTHPIQRQMKARILTNENKTTIELVQDEKAIKSNTDSKCSSTVTFMKGSEEVNNNEKVKPLESNSINTLRRKQRFLMKHTRNNSKLATLTNLDCPPLVPPLEFSSQYNNIEKMESNPISLEQPPTLDYIRVNKDLSTEMPFGRNIHFTTPISDLSRPNCPSRNSVHSERVITSPIKHNVKLKRTVSFDKPKTFNETSSKSFTDHRNPKTERSNQTCTRNTVRAKYCTNKIIKQRFYIPESANIESILRDPSDRRIKAICDRHNCDIEIYSKVPKSGFLKNIIVLAAPNSDNLRKCVRSLDYSMCWCLAAQLP